LVLIELSIKLLKDRARSLCLLDTKMHKKGYIVVQQGTKPTFAPKLGFKQVGCHVVCLSQKTSQGAHMNFMWALILLHFHFCEVKSMSMQGLKCHHFVIVWALWSQRENKGGERGSWFKSMFGAWKEKLVQGANVFGAHLLCYSIFLKIPTLKL
jgi:hypothetical protein